jgi:alpha-ketoglutarate-dependent taurine dioxygenase
MRIEPMTASIGAELVGVRLSDAIHDDGLFDEIRAALLRHKVLFLRDQDISRAEHVAFAERFGKLEDHPVAGSHPDHPGLVQIYKRPDQPMDRYENAWHTDATWREAPPLGCVLRCVESPEIGGDTMWANMVLAYENLPAHIKTQIAGLRARQHRGELRCCHADREAPGAEGAVPRPRTPSRAGPSRLARRSCSSMRSPRTSPTFIRPRTSATGRTTTRARANCCAT